MTVSYIVSGRKIDRALYLQAMLKRITQVNWEKIVKDVAPFLKPLDREGLKIWGPALFLDILNRVGKVI